jgi:cytochrome bd-type quinol oxidase subunit 2
MLIAVIFLFPLVLLCIGWMYRVLRGRIEEMEESDNY